MREDKDIPNTTQVDFNPALPGIQGVTSSHLWELMAAARGFNLRPSVSLTDLEARIIKLETELEELKPKKETLIVHQTGRKITV